MRKATVKRQTNETTISVTVSLDGTGKADIQTGVGFFDHMLDQVARHGLMDIRIRAEGDLEVDQHHTVEDVGIALGQAIHQALGDLKGVTRYADVHLPMDETLTRCALDISGRPFLVWKVGFTRGKVGGFDTELVREFFQALAQNARITLHMENLYGRNNHHIAESCFKAAARALRAAMTIDERQSGRVPSTKGSL
jgi:imidazoleglycerol-phosphate dehydratase